MPVRRGVTVVSIYMGVDGKGLGILIEVARSAGEG